jgi:KaiC/GvpD/RAD55 family RecA-like ATPase
MTEKLSTGIRGLDRELSGGIQEGSLVSIVAGPATQSEHIFHKVIGERPTVYITTLRDATAVKDRLHGIDDNVLVKDVLGSQHMDKELIREITGTRQHSMSLTDTDDTLDSVYETIDDVDRQMNIVLDPVNPLEQREDRDAYGELINKFKSKLLQTGGIGFLHCISHEDSPPLRDVTLTISDMVARLELEPRKNGMEYKLTIPKNRGGKILLTEFEIKFDSEVHIDDTRNI